MKKINLKYNFNNTPQLNNFIDKEYDKLNIEDLNFKVKNIKWQQAENLFNKKINKDSVFDYEFTLYDFMLNFPLCNLFLIKYRHVIKEIFKLEYHNQNQQLKKIKFINNCSLILGIISMLLCLFSDKFNNLLLVSYFFLLISTILFLYQLFFGNSSINIYSIGHNNAELFLKLFDKYKNNSLIKNQIKETDTQFKIKNELCWCVNKLDKLLNEISNYQLNIKLNTEKQKELNINSKLFLTGLLLILTYIHFYIGLSLICYSIIRIILFFINNSNYQNLIDFYKYNKKIIIAAFIFYFLNKNN